MSTHKASLTPLSPLREPLAHITARPLAFIGDEIAGCAPTLLKQGARPMPRAISYYRRLTIQIDQQIADTREAMARSAELLRAPIPDSFVGRKMQEPFPQESLEG